MTRSDLGFLEAYVDFVASVGRKFPDKVTWLAGWMSSRNRLKSRIVGSLEDIHKGKPRLAKKLYTTPEVTGLFLKSLKYSIRICALIIFSRWKLNGTLKKAAKKYNGKKINVLKTFSMPSSFGPSGYKEIYFPVLRDFLDKKGDAPLITVFDSLGGYKNAMKYCPKLEAIFPFEVFLTPFDLLKIWGLIIRGLILYPRNKFEFEGHDVSTEVRSQFVGDILSPDAVHNLALYLAFRKVSKVFDVSKLILTLENNPWERLVMNGSRESNPKIKILGYQHTVVPQSAAGMFPASGELDYVPAPDKIMTVGEENADLLKTFGKYGDIPVEASCAIRFQYLEKVQPLDRIEVLRVLLVAIEGFPEAVQVLECAVKGLKDHPEWKIILRPHPLYPIEQLKVLFEQKNLDISKVEVSDKKSVLEDLDRSGVVMYWGSSVGVEAFKRGLPVVHYSTGSLLSYDPMFRCQDFKWTVTMESNLYEVLESIVRLSKSEIIELRKKSQEYMARYFSPVSEESLKLFL